LCDRESRRSEAIRMPTQASAWSIVNCEELGCA
jgi:hypothetical protein